MTKTAVPSTPTVAVPIATAPSSNRTLPVGVHAPGGTAATVAVNVTACPGADGFGSDVSVVVVAAASTTCETTFDVPVVPANAASPV